MSLEFKKKYNDDKLLFFNSIFPQAKKVLKDAKYVLKKSVKEENWGEWSRTYFALKTIFECMCFENLEKLKIDFKNPNETDLAKLLVAIDMALSCS